MDLREDDTWMINAGHKIIFDRSALQSWNTVIYGTFVDHLMNNHLKNLDPRMVNASTVAKTSTYGGRTEGTWESIKGVLYAGADLRVEEAEGSRTRDFLMGPNAGKTFIDNAWQHGRISKSALFAEYHLPGTQFNIVFSGRLELNHSKILDAGEEFTEVYPETESSQVNPGLSIGGIKNFNNDISLGIWLGRAQRSGSLTERYINYFPVGQDPYELLGNPKLDPEVNYQGDLTFEFRTSKTSVNIDIFASWLQDHISSEIDPNLSPRLPNSPGVRRFINIDQAFRTGFEIGWNQALGAGMGHNLSLAYTYGQDLGRKEPLPEIAPMDISYSLYSVFLKKKLRPELTFRHVIKQNRISTEFGETETPSFSILDIAINYKMTKFLRISAGAQNLFNEAYYEHLSRSVKGSMPQPINAPGRNYFMSLNYDFM
jgi:iron complex outermembrane receptor protein